MQCKMGALMAAVALLAKAPVYAQGVVIGVAPPAPFVEVVPAAPVTGYYVWNSGYWSWTGVRYVWVPGVYVRPPRAHAAWVPGHWVAGRRGWVWVGGRWR